MLPPPFFYTNTHTYSPLSHHSPSHCLSERFALIVVFLLPPPAAPGLLRRLGEWWVKGLGKRVLGAEHLMTRSVEECLQTTPPPPKKAAWLAGAGAELELVVPGWRQKDLEQQGWTTKINIKGVEGMHSGPFCCLEMEGSPGGCRR